MLNRIKWEEDTIKTKDGEEVLNKCVLVWEVPNYLLILFFELFTSSFHEKRQNLNLKVYNFISLACIVIEEIK